MAVWGGRMGHRAVDFSSREGREGGEVRRTGIFVEPAMPMNQAPSERHRDGRPPGLCRSYGA